MVGLKGLLSCKIFKCSVVLLHGTFHANIQSLIVEVKCPKLEVISGYVDAAGRGFCTATPLVCLCGHMCSIKVSGLMQHMAAYV